ncbi:F-box C protein [Caenorhabditis elegans]|uniref:F-box C protein n=1 Tax=Caenorhabditis elegans TaxID=6239 RepID=A3KFE7_CAEEL|nr:F-box C protein [Caenorhabditis elegans]CCD62424.2 F-box C protein [Caenorhabditis elegans]
MNSNPITYPSMQCIIKHLEANKRFQLVAQCSSLVKVEKSQPLVIKKLIFNRRTISFNGVKYKLGAKNKFEAPHTLAIKQLKGRGPQINVQWLDFPDDGRILELPESFKKFKVQHFMTRSSDNPLIERFIDPKSLPLKVVHISARYYMSLLDQKILRTAEGLTIPCVPPELFHAIGRNSTCRIDQSWS